MANVSLRPDQLTSLVFFIQNPKCLLLDEPGCGKTPPVCVNQYRRWTQHGMKTLWVMPKSLIGKNVDELLRFSEFKREDIAVVDGSKMEVHRQLKSDAKVFMMGPDRLRLSVDDIPRDIGAIDVDEFHMCFGGGKSKRTQAFLKIAGRCKEMIVMTGTLINGRLDTAWPAIHAINPRYYPLGYDQFMALHAHLDDYGRPIFWRDHERLQTILRTHGIRRTFKSIFGEQEVVIQVQEVEPSEAQLKLYLELEEKAAIELDDVVISAHEGSALIRARQVLEHPRHYPDPREKGKFMDIVNGELTAKEEAILVHLADHERTGDPLIIFAALKPQQKELYRIIKEAGFTVDLLDSECSTEERAAIDFRFRSGVSQFLIGSSQIASVGYNWQFWGPQNREVNHVLYASTNYMDGDFIQAYRRVIRQKRNNPLRVTVLRYKNTIEKKIHRIVCNKSKDAHKVDPTRECLTFA